ncbi:MAG: hypothetical protein JWR56_2996 [Massilia sp.]|nr:hypothetical protein [Massilia sp.]
MPPRAQLSTHHAPTRPECWRWSTNRHQRSCVLDSVRPVQRNRTWVRFPSQPGQCSPSTRLTGATISPSKHPKWGAFLEPRRGRTSTESKSYQTRWWRWEIPAASTTDQKTFKIKYLERFRKANLPPEFTPALTSFRRPSLGLFLFVGQVLAEICGRGHTLQTMQGSLMRPR